MTRNITLIALLATMALSACTSSTKETVNPISNATSPSVSPSLQVQQQKGLKRKVAIARFTDETKNSNSIFVDNSFDNIGKQAADILSVRLTDSGQFIVFERDDLDKIQSEQKLGNIDSTLVGADYLIIGSVSEFGRKTTSETGIFSRNKIQEALATVNVRLVNTSTGQVIFSQEGSGEARAEANTVLGVGERAAFDSSLNDKAISAAISKVVSDLMENLLKEPWQAYLVAKEGDMYIMTGGSSQGIKAGDEFLIQQKGKQVKNPQTGLMIELPRTQVATATVAQTAGTGDNEVSFISLSPSLSDSADLSALVVVEKE